MGRRKTEYDIEGTWGLGRPLEPEGEKGKGRKHSSIELCYIPGTKPGILHSSFQLTLRYNFKEGSIALLWQVKNYYK